MLLILNNNYLLIITSIFYLQISNLEEQRQIAFDTIGQFENAVYLQYKANRLTASFFGQVIKRQDCTSCHNLVKDILKMSTAIKSDAMEYGRNKEAMVRERYSAENNISISESGLWVDIDQGFLAASPDGMNN